MKKTLLLLSALLTFSLCVHSQPVLTATNSIFNVGETSTTFLVDTTGIQPGQSGAGKTWDFSGIQINTNPLTSTYLAPSGTPYSASFPNSTLVCSSNSGDYAYYQLSGNDYFHLGIANSQITNAYSDPTKFLNFPFSFNSSINDNCASTFTISGMTFNMTGTTTTIADAYGSLILPSGTYNTLRVKYTQNIINATNSYTQTVNTISYFWFDSIHKNPLLNIAYIESTTMGIMQKTKSISVLSDVAGFYELASNVVNFNIYPNPTKDIVNVNYVVKERADVIITIYNSTGQKVITLNDNEQLSGNYTKTIDISKLSKGFYMTEININGSKTLKKLCIQ